MAQMEAGKQRRGKPPGKATSRPTEGQEKRSTHFCRGGVRLTVGPQEARATERTLCEEQLCSPQRGARWSFLYCLHVVIPNELEIIAAFAMLQVTGNKGLNLDSDHSNIEGGRPGLLQRYRHQGAFG